MKFGWFWTSKWFLKCWWFLKFWWFWKFLGFLDAADCYCYDYSLKKWLLEKPAHLKRPNKENSHYQPSPCVTSHKVFFFDKILACINLGEFKQVGLSLVESQSYPSVLKTSGNWNRCLIPFLKNCQRFPAAVICWFLVVICDKVAFWADPVDGLITTMMMMTQVMMMMMMTQAVLQFLPSTGTVQRH